eukprot:758320-Hanusia_phi.AAC.5
MGRLLTGRSLLRRRQAARCSKQDLHFLLKSMNKADLKALDRLRKHNWNDLQERCKKRLEAAGRKAFGMQKVQSLILEASRTPSQQPKRGSKKVRRSDSHKDMSPARSTERNCDGASEQKWDSSVSLELLRSLQQKFASERNWDQHHLPRSLALALVGEVGELCECFQWKKDCGATPGLPSWNQEERIHLGEEMSDVLLYLIRLADRCEVDLSKAVLAKIEKNGKKYPASLVKGSSAKYTAYQQE